MTDPHFIPEDRDRLYMAAAFKEARQAMDEDEVPVGAVLVRGGEIVLSDHNRSRQSGNPLAHAEKLIIDRIIASGIRYLQDYTLFVTLEPCPMCAGMLIWSRLGRLVYAASDPKAGCVGTICNLLQDVRFNHHPTITRGIMAEETGLLLKEFFSSKRKT